MKEQSKEEELISVIIPVYNVERYIKRCVESVRNQIYKKLEIILVDDGSTDCSGKICDDYAKKDNRIKIIHKKNGGLSSARNAGLKIAKGNYIGFVDSDDWISPDYYSYLYSLICNYNADIAICDYYITDGIKKPKEIDEEKKIFDKSSIMNYFFRTKGEASNYAVWNRLYKRKVVENVEFPEGYVNEDVYFSYFVFLNTNSMVKSNLQKYYYFSNNQGITRGALKKQDLCLYYVWDKIVEHTEKYNEMCYKKAVLNRKRAIFTLLSKYVIYGINDKEVFTNDWIKNETIQLRKACKELFSSKYLDGKRKVVLLALCLSPRLLRACYIKVKKK